MSEHLEDDLDEFEVVRRCERCQSRTYRMIRFFARIWYAPWLRDLTQPKEIMIPVCADCQRLGLLPWVDITNCTAINWLPASEVIAPNTEVVYV